MPFDGLWNDVDAARFAAGYLWPSTLSLEHLGRDHSLFGFAGELEIQTLVNSGGTVTRDISIVFPDSWALDETLADVSLVLQLSVNIAVTPLGTWTLQIVGGSNVASVGTGDSGPRHLTRHYLDPLPTGVVVVTLTTVRLSGTGSLTVSRDGTSGINCGWVLEPN